MEDNTVLKVMTGLAVFVGSYFMAFGFGKAIEELAPPMPIIQFCPNFRRKNFFNVPAVDLQKPLEKNEKEAEK